MWSAIAALLTIGGAILRHWYANNPARKERQANEQRQKMRQAIVDGDADTVSRNIDRLRRKAKARQRLR